MISSLSWALMAALCVALPALAQQSQPYEPSANRVAAYNNCIKSYTEEAQKNKDPNHPLVITSNAEKACKSVLSTPSSDEIQTAIGAHRACVVAYATRLAITKELPADIATAALPGCRGALNDFLSEVPVTADARAKLMSDMERIAHELGIRAVFDKRYPNLK